MDEYEQIINWIDEKCMKDVFLESVTYKDLGDEFGHAYMKHVYGGYSARVELHDLTRNMPIFKKAVLWHEFCHVWDYWETDSMGHKKKFIKKFVSKPWYIVAYILPALYAVLRMVWYEIWN